MSSRTKIFTLLFALSDTMVLRMVNCPQVNILKISGKDILYLHFTHLIFISILDIIYIRFKCLLCQIPMIQIRLEKQTVKMWEDMTKFRKRASYQTKRYTIRQAITYKPGGMSSVVLIMFFPIMIGLIGFKISCSRTFKNKGGKFIRSV